MTQCTKDCKELFWHTRSGEYRYGQCSTCERGWFVRDDGYRVSDPGYMTPHLPSQAESMTT